MWIRDGVLIHRMHVNAVSFAAALSECMPERTYAFEDLINFAFEKSGHSCAAKITFVNDENPGLLDQPSCLYAETRYNALVAEAAENCSYFPGAIELLKKFHEAGIRNFITSAVDQRLLSDWLGTGQGREIEPFLSEVLGARPGFTKGEQHFKYVNSLAVARILYIADARFEISTGGQYAQQYGVLPIGFANVITNDDIREALHMVASAGGRVPSVLSSDRLRLPGKEQLVKTLRDAGAAHVVSGSFDEIMRQLDDVYLRL